MPDFRFNRTALHSAAIDGDVAAVEKLIADGADIEAVDEFGDTPLMTAAENDEVDVTRALLKAGAAQEYVFTRKDSPEERAKQERETREMLSPTGLQTTKASGGIYETEEEAEAAFEETVASQVDFSFEPDAKSVVDHCGSLPMAKLLFDEFGIDPQHIGGDGYHPLKLFAELPNPEAVAWLLDRGYKVDLASTGETALQLAVREDSIECVRLLLNAGADPNAQDCDGWNALFSVRSHPVLDLLLERGAKIEPDTAEFLPSDFVEDEMKLVLREIEKSSGFAESAGKKLLEEYKDERG